MSMDKRTPIITVTGTKGKTTTVSVIADILNRLGKNTLKVDTTGHFINGERRSTLDDSKRTWRLVPSVSPGRYLYEFLVNPELKDGGVAVLEASLGSSALSGLGYRYHNVGVFLNVFEDHLGSSDRIKTKDDIAKAKRFVFSRLDKEGGWAVFNADDDLVVSSLDSALPELDSVSILPIGLSFSRFDVDKHYADGGVSLTVDENNHIVLRSASGDTIIADLKSIPWTFSGNFTPSVYNILASVGAVYALYDGVLPDGFREIVESVRLDRCGGRLTLLRAKSGATIIADYAHEKNSLKLVGDLARTMVEGDGKVTGVLRLAPDRTDELLRETGHEVAGHYDRFVIFDKIDGHLRKPRPGSELSRFPEVVGRVSEVFADAISEVNPDVVRILREDEAIEHAAKNSGRGDVVVVIVNDDIERSINFIRDSFDADFI